MSHLLYIPVVHSSAEMGSAASGYKAAFIARFGEQKWRERGDEYNAIWRAISEGIDRTIERRSMAFRHVKLYQDSLPVCGHEAALVAQLAAQGSENHHLLNTLIQRGAVLVGSEVTRAIARGISAIADAGPHRDTGCGFAGTARQVHCRTNRRDAGGA